MTTLLVSSRISSISGSRSIRRLAQSTDGGLSFAPNVKVTTAMSNESSANPDADAGNQYGDYEGIVALGGVIHPIWTDGRLDAVSNPATGNLFREEIFTATITV